MNKNMMTVPVVKDACKTVFAAYWTTVDVTDSKTVLRFRFPIEFGMLRAADWAEKEMHEAADWFVMCGMEHPSIGRPLHFMMPRHEGKRKLLHCGRMMELTLDMGRYQIDMVLRYCDDCLRTADNIDDAVEDMVKWMRGNAYMLRLQ
jgi:hypothetical protein